MLRFKTTEFASNYSAEQHWDIVNAPFVSLAFVSLVAGVARLRLCLRLIESTKSGDSGYDPEFTKSGDSGYDSVSERLKFLFESAPEAGERCRLPAGRHLHRVRLTRCCRFGSQWRGLSVAELAKSSGFPGKSPEVYATSATNFP